MPWLNLIIFVVSSYLLVRSGVWVVKALARIAKFLKWREFIVASILMAFSTTMPEFFVGVTSALSGKPELSLGVIIGSNIVDLTLIAGISAFIAKGITLRGKVMQRAAIYAGIYSLLPLLLMLDGTLSRADGVILLVSLLFYLSRLLAQSESFSRIYDGNHHIGWKGFKIFVHDLIVFWLGIGALLLSAEGIVYSASNLAISLNLSLVVIGAILVGLGTSLPELSFQFRTASTRHKTMGLGDAMGAVVINSAFVLGVVPLISPITVSDFSPYFNGVIFTFLTSVLFMLFTKTEHKISYREGIFLMVIYVLFVTTELLLNNGATLTLLH